MRLVSSTVRHCSSVTSSAEQNTGADARRVIASPRPRLAPVTQTFKPSTSPVDRSPEADLSAVTEASSPDAGDVCAAGSSVPDARLLTRAASDAQYDCPPLPLAISVDSRVVDQTKGACAHTGGMRP